MSLIRRQVMLQALVFPRGRTRAVDPEQSVSGIASVNRCNSRV